MVSSESEDDIVMVEERSLSEERTSSSGGTRQSAPPEQQHVVGELQDEEKQKLFLKKLYRLSQAYIEETPEEGLEHQKPTVASMVFSQPTTKAAPESSSVHAPPQSSLLNFASRLSEITSCGAMDSICSPEDSDSYKRASKNSKKKSLLLKKMKPDIPETILLEPTHVSRLEDDDSLARHIESLVQKTPPPRVNSDEISKRSPQCVAAMSSDLAYEMEISRITPVVEKPKSSKRNRNRFPSFKYNKSKRLPSYELQADEMEF